MKYRWLLNMVLATALAASAAQAGPRVTVTADIEGDALVRRPFGFSIALDRRLGLSTHREHRAYH
ncbi:MAG: hypothetical protein GY842_14245 [bacterium]|nr:hypothetical protein [bacterium]